LIINVLIILFGSFKNLVGKKLRLECDINLKPLKNLCTQDF